MKLKDLKVKKILILGLGREGQSTLNFLKKHFPDKKIGVADKKRGENYLNFLKNYDVIIKSPGIPYLTQIKKAQKQGKIITSATNIFFENCKSIVIGVTGTKGKSTTAALIAHILKSKYKDVRLVGNIGKPALDGLAGSNKKTIFVIELSSYQLEDLKFSPHIAVLLAIYPEHLDRHKNFASYIGAKENIVRYQKEGDFVVFSPAHKITANIAKKSLAKKITFSKSFGPGNLENISAATAVAGLLGVPKSKTLEAIKTFKSLPHRLEFVGEKRGIKFYNDSLATIPQATINALEALGKNVETLIAGGYDRGLDFADLGKYLATKSRIRTLILFPTTGEKIWKAVLRRGKGKGERVKKFDVNSMEEAVRIAFEKTDKGKICLLSPASASFGLFKNYEERGNKFKKLVLSS